MAAVLNGSCRRIRIRYTNSGKPFLAYFCQCCDCPLAGGTGHAKSYAFCSLCGAPLFVREATGANIVAGIPRRSLAMGTLQPPRTFEFPETEVRALREQFSFSQDNFAQFLVGISVGTLRNREQGPRKLEGLVRVLLRVTSMHPEALLDVAGVQVSKAKYRTSRSTRTAKKQTAG